MLDEVKTESEAALWRAKKAMGTDEECQQSKAGETVNGHVVFTREQSKSGKASLFHMEPAKNFMRSISLMSLPTEFNVFIA